MKSAPFVFGILVGLLSFDCGIYGSPPIQEESSAPTPILQFWKVEGTSCLQLKAPRSEASRDEVNRAESEWLAANYPGYRTVEWHRELLVPGASSEPGDETETRISSDRVEILGPDGKRHQVCFEFGPNGVRVPTEE